MPCESIKKSTWNPNINCIKVDRPPYDYWNNEHGKAINITANIPVPILIVRKEVNNLEYSDFYLKGSAIINNIYNIIPSTKILYLDNINDTPEYKNRDNLPLNYNLIENQKMSAFVYPNGYVNEDKLPLNYQPLTNDKFSFIEKKSANYLCDPGDFASIVKVNKDNNILSYLCGNDTDLSNGLTNDFITAPGLSLYIYPKEKINNLQSIIDIPRKDLIAKKHGITDFSNLRTAISGLISGDYDKYIYVWRGFLKSNITASYTLNFRCQDNIGYVWINNGVKTPTFTNYFLKDDSTEFTMIDPPPERVCSGGYVDSYDESCIVKNYEIKDITGTNSSYIYFADSSKYTFDNDTICDALIIGGGGSGGSGSASYVGGGGGAGDLVYVSDVLFKAGTYDIVIGAGGKVGNTLGAGENGGNSYINGYNINIYAAGGGGGGYSEINNGNGKNGISAGLSGGSGGGHGGGILAIGGNPGNSDNYKGSSYNKTIGSASLDNNIQASKNGVVIETKKTELNNYYYITFTNGISTLKLTNNLVCDILIIGGGGSGGNDYGAGGGAGAYIYKTNIKLQAGNYSISVGSGGIASSSIGTLNSVGVNGNDTTIVYNTQVIFKAVGGGGGGCPNISGKSGGSGGGSINTSNPGTAITGNIPTGNYGYNGGKGTSSRNGGGGGGAGGTGYDTLPNSANGGSGGPGLINNITGLDVMYAYGGNGGNFNSYDKYNNGIDGTGAGGDGANGSNGRYNKGGNGGSGIVIIRYFKLSSSVEGVLTNSYLNNGGGGGGGKSSDANDLNGGDGVSISINGTSKVYSCGGGGGSFNYDSGGTSCDGGGKGGSPNQISAPALPGTGSGGGGGYKNSLGSAGGSGVVILQYTKSALSPQPTPPDTSEADASQLRESTALSVVIPTPPVIVGGYTYNISATEELYTVFLNNRNDIFSETFITNNNYSIKFNENTTCDVLIVGGGGCGGHGNGGGGGGGQVITKTITFMAGITYDIKVGIFGSDNSDTNRNGGDSSIIGTSINLIAGGGGAGGTIYPNAGSRGNNGSDGGSGSSGGNTAYGTSTSNGGYGGSGADIGDVNGNGSSGKLSMITGNILYIGAGGGGGKAGLGGRGGGGKANKSNYKTEAYQNASGYGNGGGASYHGSQSGGRGSSGIVIIRRPNPQVIAARIIKKAAEDKIAQENAKRAAQAAADAAIAKANDAAAAAQIALSKASAAAAALSSTGAQTAADAASAAAADALDKAQKAQNAALQAAAASTIQAIASIIAQIVAQANKAASDAAAAALRAQAAVEESKRSVEAAKKREEIAQQRANATDLSNRSDTDAQNAIINPSETLPQPTILPIIAGGTINKITNTNYSYAIFTSSSGTNTITFNEDITCDILVVGGGGGGGSSSQSGSYQGGGGGGGGVIKNNSINFSKGTYNITIGAGGNGQSSNGGSSSISGNGITTITAGGGGGGGGENSLNGSNGLKGGSGGGGAYNNGTTTNPGNSLDDSGNIISSFGKGAMGIDSSGGGGGARGHAYGANSGVGVISTISGTSLMYGSGGSGNSGAIHSGGGAFDGHAINNRGGGGGGGGTANKAGGKGSDGIVIIRFANVRSTITSSITINKVNNTEYSYVKFNYSDNPGTITFDKDTTVYYLAVGGGGNSGAGNNAWNFGAGGGGGVKQNFINFPTGTYKITVGKGGKGNSDWSCGICGDSGGASTIVGNNINIIAGGGGGGGNDFWACSATSGYYGGGGGGNYVGNIGTGAQTGNGCWGGDPNWQTNGYGGNGSRGGGGGSGGNASGDNGGIGIKAAGLASLVIDTSIYFGSGGAGRYGSAYKGGGNINAGGIDGTGGGGGSGRGSNGGGHGTVVLVFPSTGGNDKAVVETTGNFTKVNNSYGYYTFTESAKFIVSRPGYFKILLVGGGGNNDGLSYRGGGGGGGVSYYDNFYIPVGTYNITVGKSQGTSSINLSGIQSATGGAPNSGSYGGNGGTGNLGSGGNGGGGSMRYGATGAIGNDGIANSITGTTVYYGGGGGGGGFGNNFESANGGRGGGGGPNVPYDRVYGSYFNGANGVDGLGGGASGGGGWDNNFRRGGYGVVIIGIAL